MFKKAGLEAVLKTTHRSTFTTHAKHARALACLPPFVQEILFSNILGQGVMFASLHFMFKADVHG